MSPHEVEISLPDDMHVYYVVIVKNSKAQDKVDKYVNIANSMLFVKPRMWSGEGRGSS